MHSFDMTPGLALSSELWQRWTQRSPILGSYALVVFGRVYTLDLFQA